jgi:hypothetical protein
MRRYRGQAAKTLVGVYMRRPDAAVPILTPDRSGDRSARPRAPHG